MSLANLSDKEFRDLVDQELRKEHPQTTAAERTRLSVASEQLRAPETINRWIAVLEVMKSSAETQLGAKRAEIKKLHGTIPQTDYEAKCRVYQGWKPGTMRFLHSVEQRLLEARADRMELFGYLYPARVTEERNTLSQHVLYLIEAVQVHRETVLAEYDPTDADETLWETILKVA